MTRRTAAMLLLLGLSVGRVGLCAGWEPTPQARMACCVEGDDCPMHKPAAHGTMTSVTQAEADQCCSVSDRGDRATSTSPFVAVASVGPAVSAISLVAPVAGTPFETWRALVPPLVSPVPTHLRLSVFLI